ncbi:MAG: hypothetical protein Q9174_000771 [Haloplaca sp. 1 TL-2023]
MPKALAKVQKQIAKKKKGATSSLHENSRDAKRLRRAGARSGKLEKLAAATAKTYQPYVHRIEFFRSGTQNTRDTMTTEAMQALITQYSHLIDEETNTYKTAADTLAVTQRRFEKFRLSVALDDQRAPGKTRSNSVPRSKPKNMRQAFGSLIWLKPKAWSV